MLVKKDPGSIRAVKKIGVYIGVPGLGDLLFIIPLFRALKQLFPGARTVFIGKLARYYVRPVFDNCPYIDDILEFHLYESISIRGFRRFVRALKRERFDLIVDTQRKFVPSLLMALGGARYMVSYSSNSFFSDFRVPVPDRKTRHTADISLDLARAVGAEEPSVELEITVTEQNRNYAEQFYSEHGITPGDLLVGLIPSAGHQSRRWNAEKFGELADRLREELDARIICFGSTSDKTVIEEIICNTSAPVIVEDFSRGSILDSAALMERCNVIVGVDSGPLHVADAAGTPCVGIYGPTLPDRFGLLGRRKKEICHYLDCSPCSNPECEHRKCLEQITPDEAFEAVRSILD